MFEGFQGHTVETAVSPIFVVAGGSGPALLLLHGFPETHLMWRDVAPQLMAHFTVICADLPGYGASGYPIPAANHYPHSKRAMAATLAEAMARLGFEHFYVAGHDRGARVAYRMALDLPNSVDALAVLDVVPTAVAWDRADARFALGFWPWSLLAQAEPLPERLLQALPEAVIDDALGNWGSAADAFPDDVKQAYVEALRDPQRVHSICEEYRAAAGIDRDHDRDDLTSGRKIVCPMLALWSGRGALSEWYEAEGGPMALWQKWAAKLQGQAVDAGHFFPEEEPRLTAGLLKSFFASSKSH